MNRRTTLLGLGTLAVLALSGCTSFAPVYGDMAGGAPTARFNFAPPTNRAEQIILQRLQIAFPGTASPSDPTLTVSARRTGLPSAMSDAMSVASPVQVRVEATVTVTAGSTVVFQATRFTDTAYQGGKLVPTNTASAIGAEETAAESTAESLRAAILAGYRP